MLSTGFLGKGFLGLRCGNRGAAGFCALRDAERGGEAEACRGHADPEIGARVKINVVDQLGGARTDAAAQWLVVKVSAIAGHIIAGR